MMDLLKLPEQWMISENEKDCLFVRQCFHILTRRFVTYADLDGVNGPMVEWCQRCGAIRVAKE